MFRRTEPARTGRSIRTSAVGPLATALFVAAGLPPFIASCAAHLLQPQTYYLATARVDQQRQEYLAKELLTGLPEAIFLRWYTRTPAWSDDLRPCILDQESRDGRTVYRVGSDGRSIAEVAFRNATLEGVGEWLLSQESIVSGWRYVTLKPRSVFRADLDRLETLDPASEPLHPEDRPVRGEVCGFEKGSVYETLAPLAIWCRGADGERSLTGSRGLGPQGARALGTLPAGTRLVVRHWGALSGRLAAESPGGAGADDYVVETFRADLSLCPEGSCAAVGSEARVARDLVVIEEERDGRLQRLAVVPAQSRIPVWAKRAGTLEAGQTVRVRSWDPCALMAAEIEIPDAARRGFPSGPIKVPLAPPGIFVSLRAAGPSGSVEAEAADQPVQ